MIIGFTGTQKGMTAAQKREVSCILGTWASVSIGLGQHQFHHGMCVGADEQANEMADVHCYKTFGHPANNVPEDKKSKCHVDVQLPAKPALVRNHDIVDIAATMIACPKTVTEELHSGTWATIRYARHIERRMIVVNPDGGIIKENFNV